MRPTGRKCWRVCICGGRNPTNSKRVSSNNPKPKKRGLSRLRFSCAARMRTECSKASAAFIASCDCLPFDAAHRRHTSFAAVDVLPELEEGEAAAVEIRPEDLRVETFKSGGGRRPVRQQDGIGGAHHPRADRPHRRIAARALAGAKPRGGNELASRQARCPSGRRARSPSRRHPRRATGQRSGARRFAPTCCSRTSSLRITGPTLRWATRNAFSTATSIRSCGHIFNDGVRALRRRRHRARSLSLDRHRNLRGALHRARRRQVRRAIATWSISESLPKLSRRRSDVFAIRSKAATGRFTFRRSCI